MPTYGKKEYKESNVNYLNKDFKNFKNSLVQYAKSYFPNSYKDFNETSPGMMLIEMAAYVGDVTSFYIDQQYREMLLPLAEERRNIVNIAKMLGYKTKPIYASHVNLTFTQVVNSISGNEGSVDYANASVFDAGIQLKSSTDGDILFETLDVVDFTVNQAIDTRVTNTIDGSTGLVSNYLLSRTVRAISSETKTITFQVGAPEKFLRLTLPETNVIDVVSCVDTNGNNWYEVDYLAQDRVPIETHYTNDDNRTNSYYDIDESISTSVSVPYTLQYIQTNKRFITEVSEENTTSLVFGNGVVKNGSTIDSNFLDLEQAGITIPGQTSDLTTEINELLTDDYDTLGETPNQTTLTVTYRVGGGISSNVVSGDLTTINSGENAIGGNKDGVINSVTNATPAVGGKGQETIEEIREKTKLNFSSQNRAVTKHDYKARVLNMSSKFGSIAKVFVSRLNTVENDVYVENVAALLELINTIDVTIEEVQQSIVETDFTPPSGQLGTIDIHILSYDNNKHLIGNPLAGTGPLTDATDYIPKILKQNIERYLLEYRILNDEVSISDGYIINFGVIFDVLAHQHANKSQVKLKCIEKIKEYFRIEKMQFSQPIYVSQLEYELMDIDGVRAVNQVCITQNQEYDKTGILIPEGQTLFESGGAYYYSLQSGEITTDQGNAGYGYLYDFSGAYDNGIIRPPDPSNPGVFELKYPNRNIIGVVR